MKKRAEYRNEVKTRLPDKVYSAMQEFKRLHFIDSDSAALARIAQILLCGIVPNADVPVSADAERIAQTE